MLFHGNSVNFSRFIFDVLGGISYWFTSAMVISQVVLLSVVFLIKKQSVWLYWMISIPLFFAGWYMNNLRAGNTTTDFFPWFYKTGLEYSFIMTLGGIYGHYEAKIDSLMKYFIIAVLIGYISILTVAWSTNVKLMLMGLGGKCNIEGFLCIMCGICLLIALCKKMKSINCLTYIGRNSIIFYFFSGAYTAAIGNTALRLSDKMYMVTFIVAMISIILGIFSVYIINCYIPFLVDLRKLKQKWAN